jgi:hypothetical protein
MPLADVQHRIAQLIHATHPLLDEESPTLGLMQLLPAQQQAAAHLRAIIARHGGALLADNVGSGKTFVALAVARHYESVHIVAPATLLPMWRKAIERTLLASTNAQVRVQAQVHSLQRFSRGQHASFLTHARTLVVIDEAHQLRGANTARYRALARAMAGTHALLLSATPLHNAAEELHTLCALFAGQAHEEMIVRQSAPMPPAPTRRLWPDSRPTIIEHRTHPLPQDAETLAMLLALPAPLPTHDGAAAGALIRLGLLRAWCSSDAALAGALRSRQLRGEALRDALQTGRHPTSEELRSWIIGEGEGQLAFPELLVAHDVEATTLLTTLEQHLHALTTLARHHATTGDCDALRASRLRAIMDRHVGIPIIAFSQFERTVRAVYRALADIPGIGMLTSSTGRIASGPIGREELLGLFAPTAQGRSPPPSHQAVRLLIATDLLAEGVNLQDAGVVVHLDLPWTHALLEQRVGRCARLGSPHAAVHVYRLRASAHATAALRAEARILRKAKLAKRHVAGTHAKPSPPEAMARVRETIGTWHRSSPVSQSEHPPIAFSVCWRHDTRRSPRALVLLQSSLTSHNRLLAVRPGARAPVQCTPQALLAMVHDVKVATTPSAEAEGVTQPSIRQGYEQVHRCVGRWIDRQVTAALLGVSTHRWRNIDGNSQTPVQMRALRLLHRTLTHLTVAERAREMPRVASIRSTIDAVRGAGMEAALATWCARAPAFSHDTTAQVCQWLADWEGDPVLRHAASPTTSPPDLSLNRSAPAAPVRYQLVAMILMLPINLRA